MARLPVSALALAVVIAAPAQAASSCHAQPDSPACSAGKDCHGAATIENGSYMAFTEDGPAIELCAGESCAAGKVTLRRPVGALLLVQGTVRQRNAHGHATGAASPVTALIDRKAAIAHVAGQGQHVLMDCSPTG